MAFIDQLRTVLGNLTTGQKITMAVVFALSMLAFGGLLYWANKPDYQVLYANLSPDDAGTVIAKLKEQRVPYELSGGGTVVSVPAAQVYETRLQLASQGLPQGAGVGFEIFDKTQLGMTDFVQKMHFQRALQGELTRTILQLSEVVQARVHIALPEKSLFIDQEKKPTASVVLKLKGGALLSRDQVNGIVHLVASSVEGLAPSGVTVVDMHGKILSANSDDSAIGRMTTSQLEYQRKIEKDLEKQVQTMFEGIMGPGKAITRVTASLDFSQIEQTEEKYDPDTIAIRSEQRSEEKSSNTSTPKGVPGVRSNLGTATAEVGGTNSQSGRSGETINYEVSKTVRHSVLPVGKIEKLSVAVVLDGTYKVSKDAQGKETREYAPLSKTQLDQYQKLVANAVGLDPQRGDLLQVTNVPFETAVDGEAMTAKSPLDTRALIMAGAKYGTIALISILLILFVVKPIVGALTTPRKTGKGTSLPAGKTAEQLEAEIRAKMTAEETPTPEAIAREAVKRQLTESAQKSPEDFSGLLKIWVEEGK
ncbi:MAG: flagellar basal-body MS-ring/collar protein FliF [Nitrospirota bacterium]|nr:flagellar basal-body MS-ring/collar protein FliF [Nitrospirota bacterium]